ncbi:MAG: hypothetical protein HON90_09305 [Halobacteriovoraceae bacterium]|nr:hypothetical protein [Halobacteriovoraceae bacterium]
MNDTSKAPSRNSKNNSNQGTNRNRRPNNRRPNGNNKNRRPKSLTPARLLQKYDNLLEQYLLARKKFFETRGRIKNKQLGKVEKNYQLCLKNLRTFEANLKDWQKETLAGKINAYPDDRQYTKEHDIEPIGDEVSFVGEFEDPHLLTTQKAEDWSQDTEESSGTIDDYNAYKGISA